LKLVDLTRAELVDYTCAQVANLVPDGRGGPLRSAIEANLDEALARLEHCVAAVRWWTPGEFNYLHSTQYCIFVYYLSNTIWRNAKDAGSATRLFLLNKALNGIDLFYEIEMPRVFFIGHSVGIVLAKATYADYLILYQCSTVGKNHGVAPVIGEGVVMYPNTAIIGRCTVGARTILSQGTSIINRDTPGDCVAYPGADGALVLKPSKRDVLNDIFR
jgi:serine O-acetyltransferase